MNDRANMLDEEETPTRTDEVLMAASSLLLTELEAVTEELLTRRETLRSDEAGKLRDEAGKLRELAESEYAASKKSVNSMLARADELDPPVQPAASPKAAVAGDKGPKAAVEVRKPPSRPARKATRKTSPKKRRLAEASKNVCSDDEVLRWLPKGEGKADYKVSGISALAQAHKCDVFAVGRSLKRLCEAGKAVLGGSPPRWAAYYQP